MPSMIAKPVQQASNVDLHQLELYETMASSRRGETMTTLPVEPLIPGNSLITETPEAGRALAITLARHSIHAMQHTVEVLVEGRARYANDPASLIAAGHVIAVEFATIAAANNYWRSAR
jgi:hypothetical protein